MEQTLTVFEQQEQIITKSIELFRTAPEILRKNQLRSSKALQVGEDIINQWKKAWSITDHDERMAALAEADERSNNYLVNCRDAKKQENEVRAGITQMMDSFRSMFTEAENQIDITKKGSVPSLVQDQRNKFATEVARIQEERRREAERKAAKSLEATNIRAEMETKFSNDYLSFLTKKKGGLMTYFNEMTIETYSERSENIRTAQFVFSHTRSGYPQHVSYHSDGEIKEILDEVWNSKVEEFKANFQAELTLLRDEIVDKLPAKLYELEEQKRLKDEEDRLKREAEEAERVRQEAMAKANAEEKKRLAAEAEKARQEEAAQQKILADQREAQAAEQRRREEEERQRLDAEAEEQKRKAEQEAELKRQGEATLALFEKEAAVAEVAAPDARQGYEINVLHPVGYTQIFQLWFQEEGGKLPIDKIGNMKMDQMKAWCEKHAHKTGTKIESKFLVYEETFKAVNKKVK